MKKLLLLTLLTITLSCSKDDDNDCECIYYDKIGKSANCEFDRIYSDDLERATFPEDIERLSDVAENFKCD